MKKLIILLVECYYIKKMLATASWNIWFDESLREHRTRGIVNQLKQTNYDLFCLQEVIPQTAEIIKNKFPKWDVAGYPLQSAYDTLILSKHKIIDWQRLELPHTNMGRNLLLAKIFHAPSGKTITVATFHLESEFGKMKIKKEMQLIYIYNIIADLQDEPILLLGDTNFTKKEKDPELPDFIEDAYLGASKPGGYNYTYDGKRNSNVRNAYLRSRLDRVYYSKKNLRLSEFSFLGDRPIMTGDHEDPIFLSDHFGIRTCFTF